MNQANVIRVRVSQGFYKPIMNLEPNINEKVFDLMNGINNPQAINHTFGRIVKRQMKGIDKR